MKTTTKNFEIETNKININFLVQERQERGYIQGVKLVNGIGSRNEKLITDMIISGDDVIIYTESYKKRVSVKNITKHITIEY